MSFFDTDLIEKASLWKIPLETPRSIRGKLTIFKAIPGLAAVGIVFIPVGIAVGILFLSLGMFNDIIIRDWTKTTGQPIEWVNSTGERVNGNYIPGIKVEYNTDQNKTIKSTVKITDLSKVVYYLKVYENQEPISIEYSVAKPDVARIYGLKSTAMPIFFVFFPVIFIAVGFLLLFLATRVRSRMVNVFENGTFAVGKITKITVMRNNRNSKYANSTNKAVYVKYEFIADGETITRKVGVSQKYSAELSEGSEIPVIYSVFGYKYKAYSPLLYQVEFA